MVLGCSDCGGTPMKMSEKALAAGSSVREPGEPICQSCNARRIILVRTVDALPDRLEDLRGAQSRIKAFTGSKR